MDIDHYHIPLHWLCPLWGSGVEGGLNNVFPFSVLYHWQNTLNSFDSYIWQIYWKCKRGDIIKMRKESYETLHFTECPLPLYAIWINSLQHFWSYAPDKKIQLREIIQKVSKEELRFLYTSLPLNILYHFMKFQHFLAMSSITVYNLN